MKISNLLILFIAMVLTTSFVNAALAPQYQFRIPFTEQVHTLKNPFYKAPKECPEVYGSDDEKQSRITINEPMASTEPGFFKSLFTASFNETDTELLAKKQDQAIVDAHKPTIRQRIKNGWAVMLGKAEVKPEPTNTSNSEVDMSKLMPPQVLTEPEPKKEAKHETGWFRNFWRNPFTKH
jgi:hypothetical protein